ncbi:hypothetical protein VAS14_12144 [Photobacterium angustum S14]|uniref:Uncharacterized protein n=1 Tax=Photobacterium angustum (strain S14 / CCUG 15956) TaxID=314292 RepID=Q1ZVJ6_PHOAS|nr:hypothetical protein VAS14_12144 [Photobacterium angustum S14]
MILYQLTSPLGYLFIKGIKAKLKYDLFLPILFTLFTLIFLYFANGFDLIKVVSKDGLINDLTSFIINLPGFLYSSFSCNCYI